VPTLGFTTSYRYDDSEHGILVPLWLCLGDQSVRLIAKLDSGASNCIFERRYGELLGLNVEAGRCQYFHTMAGRFPAYEHEVTIQTFGIELTAQVFFAQDHSFSRSFVGRSGWLDRLRIELVDYDRMLYLSPYD
jgi:hypothetical protein